MASNRYSLVCCPSVLFGCISPKGRANQGCGIGQPFRWLLSETHLSRLARVWLKGWVHSAHGHIEPPLVGVTTGDFCSEAGQAWSFSEKHGSCIWSEWTESSIMCVHNTEEDKVSLLLSPNEPLERQYSGMGWLSISPSWPGSPTFPGTPPPVQTAFPAPCCVGKVTTEAKTQLLQLRSSSTCLFTSMNFWMELGSVGSLPS